MVLETETVAERDNMVYGDEIRRFHSFVFSDIAEPLFMMSL